MRHTVSFALIFLLVLGSFNLMYAQQYVPAIIYSRLGDTIVCQIKTHSNYTSVGFFTYKKEADKSRHQILREDIKMLIVQSDTFECVRTFHEYSASEVNMYQLRINGFLKLYSKTYEQTVTLNPAGTSVDNGHEYDVYYLMKKGVPLTKITRAGFKKRLSQFIGDDKDLLLKIGTEGYTLDNIKKIVGEYNAWHRLNSKQE